MQSTANLGGTHLGKITLVIMTCAIVAGAFARADARSKDKNKHDSLEDYIRRMGGPVGPVATPSTPGSLWVDNGRMANLVSDYKASRVGDLVTINISQNLDIIFCCNVLIYFDLISKRRVLRHFYNNLLPHGYLFLGSSESLYGVSEDFCLVHLPGSTSYVKREALPVGGETI